MKHVGFPLGLDITIQQVERLLTKQTEESCRFIILDESEKAIGECNYKKKTEKSCEIGIKICDLSLHRKGYGSDALSSFISYLFTVYGLECIYLTVLEENTAARALYEKLGFISTELTLSAWTAPSGILHNVVHMELRRAIFKV